MSFYDNLKEVCVEKGLKMSPVVSECSGTSGSIGGWKSGKWPNSEIVAKLAARLDVSCDRLLLGEDAKKEPALGVSENGQEMLALYERLSERDQILLIGRLQEMVEPLLGSADKKVSTTRSNVKAV